MQLGVEEGGGGGAWPAGPAWPGQRVARAIQFPSTDAYRPRAPLGESVDCVGGAPRESAIRRRLRSAQPKGASETVRARAAQRPSFDTGRRPVRRHLGWAGGDGANSSEEALSRTMRARFDASGRPSLKRLVPLRGPLACLHCPAPDGPTDGARGAREPHATRKATDHCGPAREQNAEGRAALSDPTVAAHCVFLSRVRRDAEHYRPLAGGSLAACSLGVSKRSSRFAA